MTGIDEKDRQILALLHHNARLSYSDLGTQVGLSRTAVKTRITALEQSGMIRGYHAVINPVNSTGIMTFVVNLETKAENFEEAKAIIARSDTVVTLVQTTGSCHLLAICVSENTQTMRNFMRTVYQTVPGILSINAHSVLDIIKEGSLPESSVI